MDALHAIRSRRSIRNYSKEPVTDAEVRAVLDAAMCAPSAFGQRSTRYVIVRDAETRARLASASKHAAPVGRAPVAIVVCGDTSAERHPGTYFVHDAIAALENLLVAANAAGLGAVWIGVHPWEDRMTVVGEAVGLPPHVIPVATIALGHPEESKPAADRYAADFVHVERWDRTREGSGQIPERVSQDLGF